MMWKVKAIVFAVMMVAGASAQSPGPAPGFAMAPSPDYSGAPSPALDCFPYLLNVSDCLTFVEGDRNLTKPDPGCCPELSKLVDTQPVCLCQLLGNSAQLGISVDVKRAVKLPAVCNVSTPPVSLCAAIGYPVSDDDLSPSAAPSPGGAEAAAPPSPGGDVGSAASNHQILVVLAPLLFTLFF